VSFLSHVILEEGISVDPSKIQNMLRWNTPASVIDFCSFLGIIGYYIKFSEGFPYITKPVTELHGKDKKFK
jgi:hypothetical protein